jgi:Uma2 family endonuclease
MGIFVRREHLDRLSQDRLDGPADLVIELVSDSSTKLDRDDKFHECQSAGIPEYIIIDPRPRRHRVEYYLLNAEGKYLPLLPDDLGRYHSTVLPGFWLDPEWFRQDPLPDDVELVAEMMAQVQAAPPEEQR